jgi:hypothetical protein
MTEDESGRANGAWMVRFLEGAKCGLLIQIPVTCLILLASHGEILTMTLTRVEVEFSVHVRLMIWGDNLLAENAIDSLKVDPGTCSYKRKSKESRTGTLSVVFTTDLNQFDAEAQLDAVKKALGFLAPCSCKELGIQKTELQISSYHTKVSGSKNPTFRLSSELLSQLANNSVGLSLTYLP